MSCSVAICGSNDRPNASTLFMAASSFERCLRLITCTATADQNCIAVCHIKHACLLRACSMRRACTYEALHEIWVRMATCLFVYWCATLCAYYARLSGLCDLRCRGCAVGLLHRSRGCCGAATCHWAWPAGVGGHRAHAGLTSNARMQGRRGTCTVAGAVRLHCFMCRTACDSQAKLACAPWYLRGFPVCKHA